MAKFFDLAVFAALSLCFSVTAAVKVGDSCTVSDNCTALQHSDCTGSAGAMTCTCDNNYLAKNDNTKCLSVVNGTCNQNDDCVPFANCTASQLCVCNHGPAAGGKTCNSGAAVMTVSVVFLMAAILTPIARFVDSLGQKL